MLPQDTTHLIQRPCYQRGSPCLDLAGNRTTRRTSDHRKETPCLPFIMSGQNHLARHCEREKTRQTEEEMGRVSYLVSSCFEPSQPQRITSGLNTNFILFPKLLISQVMIPQVMFFCFFFGLFIFRGHSTREPASNSVTYFTLRAYTGTKKSGEGWKK